MLLRGRDWRWPDAKSSPERGAGVGVEGKCVSGSIASVAVVHELLLEELRFRILSSESAERDRSVRVPVAVRRRRPKPTLERSNVRYVGLGDTVPWRVLERFSTLPVRLASSSEVIVTGLVRDSVLPYALTRVLRR